MMHNAAGMIMAGEQTCFAVTCQNRNEISPNIWLYPRWLLRENSKLTIIHPDLLDGLLFDDETFSRTRGYSWAIDAMEAFQET